MERRISTFRVPEVLCVAMWILAGCSTEPRPIHIPPELQSKPQPGTPMPTLNRPDSTPQSPPAAGAFKLFPTQNIWTQLKLDTRDGRIWQVSISTTDSPEDIPISVTSKTEQPYVGRFTLEPTKNLWNFILLDTSDGRTWQVQWGQNSFVRPMSTPGVF
jgi:hypothetical protein